MISSLEDEQRREAAEASDRIERETSDRIEADAAASVIDAAEDDVANGATTGIEPIAREEATR